jgi:hypothetical protein
MEPEGSSFFVLFFFFFHISPPPVPILGQIDPIHTIPSYLSKIEGQVPYLYPQEEVGPVTYTPRDWVPFLSPPTTRRDTVEVFELASTRGKISVLKFL